jgi:hypothetical protein
MHKCYPTEFANSTQHHKKIVGTRNKPIKTQTISFSSLKVKETQKFV